MTNLETGRTNRGFVAASDDLELHAIANVDDDHLGKSQQQQQQQRQQWNNGLEFLMSCIAMSVGLGNVWRFPFTAYENGGGAFLVPYLVVLLLVGKPCYYFEMIVGQFSGRSCVKLWSCVPALRGVGWAQMFTMIAVTTYYCSLMSLTLRYLLDSFSGELPWTKCLDEWDDECRADDGNASTTPRKSSAELYFTRTVLHEKANIDDGIGLPDWRLTLCLLFAWLCIFAVLARGLRSSGKAAYFLAVFPYIVMIALLARAVSLEGAVNGILFFVRPDWSKLVRAEVWYAAVTQCFFSLTVCFGGLVTYASYNDFRHNIYRDMLVVTSLDTLTSLIAGFTIFGILGNLAHELGSDDVTNVVRGGTGLAFISYPDAIAKFTWMPQLFAVLFFMMLYILGIGSGIALAGGIISIVSDQYPKLRYIHVATVTSLVGFAVGTVYCTPGGQFILALVDYYAASFVVFVLASLEVTALFWLYGLEDFLDDVEFMLGRRPSLYWRFCWSLVTPGLLIAILVYTICNLKPLDYAGVEYPASAHVAGWTLLAFGVGQVPFWCCYSVYTNRKFGLPQMLLESLKPSEDWGPMNEANFASWRRFKQSRRSRRDKRNAGRLKQFVFVLLGREDKLDRERTFLRAMQE